MEPLSPVVGIVGAGQLARMTVQAAIPLAVPVRVLAARPDDGAAQVWPHVEVGSPDSLDALRRFAAGCDILTFDHELVDPEHLRALEAEGRCLRPSAAAQRYAQDKAYQRGRFAALGLPVPAHRLVREAADLTGCAAEHGWPVVAKATRGGYDGRGVWVLDGPLAAEDLAERCASSGVSLLAERFLPIEMELAVLLARRPGGECAVYPLVQTVQADGICHEVLAPAPVHAEVATEAERLALAVAEATGVTGMLAVELFLAEGRLWVNEIATRPHNSGHFSIEGAATSQFENHLRAVLDWPLGATALTAPAVAMANVLGNAAGTDLAANLPAALSVPGVRIHLYGKEPRPGRKIGHVTALGAEVEETRARAVRAASILAWREPA
jgi:5-(carboxyamino)imidazole ribonucleotide synthase